MSQSPNSVGRRVDEERELRHMKVELHTSDYIVVGSIQTSHERLKDLLENWFHPFLPLREAAIVHRGPKGKVEREEVDKTLVRLSEILIAMPSDDIPSGDHSGHPKFVPKYAVPAFLQVGQMAIEGEIYIRKEEDAEFGMMASPEPFIAVTGARVTYLHEESASSFTADVVIVNRDRIQLLRPL